jgi:hypothetical protein
MNCKENPPMYIVQVSKLFKKHGKKEYETAYVCKSPHLGDSFHAGFTRYEDSAEVFDDLAVAKLMRDDALKVVDRAIILRLPSRYFILKVVNVEYA